MLSTPRATCSVTALAALAQQGTPVIVCDGSMKPAGMMLPFRGHHEIGRRITAQAAASVPLRRRIWKGLIRSKIAGQAAVLAEAIGADHGIERLARRVRSGDPENVEAQAARRYWRYLLGTAFRRSPGEDLSNRMLDYSYTVLRAAVVRSLCVAGLHPSLGIHHHHRANAFALADDLIEPFRPAADRVVYRTIGDGDDSEHLTPTLKRALVKCLEEKIPFQGELRTVTDGLTRAAASLAGAILGTTKELSLPWVG